MLSIAVANQPTLAHLRALQRSRMLVRVERSKVEPGHVDGRIVGCSSKLVALAVLNDGRHPDGFNVFLRADVTKLLIPAPYAEFAAKILRLRGERLPRLPKLDLTSWRPLVSGAAQRFPLVTLHMERVNPDVCYIGRPTRLTPRTGTLITIDPAGAWDRDETDWLNFKWKDVTRVDLGGAYEEALALVAGA
jgi:hypothetical protein